MLKNLRKFYSPNFNLNKRREKDIKFIILHYTGMEKENDALKRLTNPSSRVSCHYFVSHDGKILELVPDLYIAWHAGKSCWEKKELLNSNSIGIEISNPGHEHKYNNYKKKQISALISLVSKLKSKYNIKKRNILGHSDIAPDRKKDPGEKFPWKLMHKKKLSIWHNIKERDLIKLRNQKCNKLEKLKFLKNLRKIGYSILKKNSVIKAFQRKFRQSLVNGKIDKECLFISISIVQNK